MERLAFAREKQMNYLLGIGPAPDGSGIACRRRNVERGGPPNSKV